MPKRKCQTKGCGRSYYAKGFCATCYMRDLRHQRMSKKKAEEPVRIDRSKGWVKVSECCQKPVQEGEPHEYGRLYCLRCKLACLWNWKRSNVRK